MCNDIFHDFSISEDQMKIINPMETIREEQPLELNRSHLKIPNGYESKIHSTMVSPLGSPSTSRHHLTNNILVANHLKSQLSLSKSTLDGLKMNSQHDNKSENKLLQTLQGSTTVPKPPAYIDGWLNQEPGSRFDISAVPAKLPSPLTHQRVLSQAIARESIVTTPGNYDFDSASMMSLEKPESSVAPSVTPSIAPSISILGVASGISATPSATIRYEDEKQVFAVQGGEPDKSEAKTEEKSSEEGRTLQESSSNESLPEYEAPDSNQCTVNSLTPLLDSNKAEAV